MTPAALHSAHKCSQQTFCPIHIVWPKIWILAPHHRQMYLWRKLHTPDSSLQRKGGHYPSSVCSKEKVSRFYFMLPWINPLLERAPAQFESHMGKVLWASLWALQSRKPYLALKYIWALLPLTHISPLCSRHHVQGAEYRCKFFPTAALYSRET